MDRPPDAIGDATSATVRLASAGPPPASSASAAASFSVVPPSAVGRLVAVWRILLGLAWSAAFFAYAAVWQASVQLGIGLWWIGPRAQPTSVWLRIVPFVVCLGVALCVAYGVRRLPEIAVIASLGLAVFAVPDLSRSIGLAVTEFLVAGALLTVSVLSLFGRIRRATPAAPPTGPTDDG